MSASTDVAAISATSTETDPPEDGLVGRVPAAKRRQKDLKRSRWQRFFGVRPEPEPSSMQLLEEPDDDKIGICCSGGGIRSAAYNLGALQAMQEDENVLSKSRYLSAVSGGSYIAAAFCMVAKASHSKSDDDSDPELFDAAHPPFHRNSPEEQYLRNRSSYMAPNGAEKVFLGFRVLMGLAFNLVFLGLPVLALGILLGDAFYNWAYDDDKLIGCGAGGCDASAAVPDGVLYAFAAAAGLVIASGLVNLLVRFRKDRVRRAMERFTVVLILMLAGCAVILIVVPVLVAAVFGPETGEATALKTADAPGVGAAGGTGLGALVIGALALARERLGGVVESDGTEKRFKQFRGLPRKLRLAVAYVVGAVVGPAIFLLIATFGAALALAHDGWEMLGIAGAAVVLFAAIYSVADLNTWSLHPLYRRRLCTAFALKRVKDLPADDEGETAQVSAKAVERDFERLVTLSKSGVKPHTDEPGAWPTLLVCAAANVSDPGATPPGRGVTSFTFSPTEIGGPLVGGARTAAFEEALRSNRRRDITLPAAVAMSGAALAPSMGKLTRKPFTFLLALANIRLGVWVPNPRFVDDWRVPPGRVRRTWRSLRGRLSQNGKTAPERRDVRRVPRPHYLFRELMGRNRIDAPFLYVTDGGHYDNLGLVELLRRGCMKVYCFDASGGATARDLGDAIALARSELGVDVEFEKDLREVLRETNTPPLAEESCVVGTIKYPGRAERGRLVYAPTVMTRGVPWDVAAFRDSDPEFPHHSTIDQLYTDQKFEAYRALGHYAGTKAKDAMKGAGRPRSKDRPPTARSNGATDMGPMFVVARAGARVRRHVTKLRRPSSARP